MHDLDAACEQVRLGIDPGSVSSSLSVDCLIDLPVELPLVVLQWDSLASRHNIEGEPSSNALDFSDCRQLSGPKIWHCENDQSTNRVSLSGRKRSLLTRVCFSSRMPKNCVRI
jgi:hypothetical protein